MHLAIIAPPLKYIPKKFFKQIYNSHTFLL